MPDYSVFVADTAFVDPAIVRKHNLLAVFPTREGDGAYRETLDGLLRRSKLQSAYYEAVMPALMRNIARHFAAADDQARHFVRAALVAITSLFADRCIRVIYRTQQLNGSKGAAVAVQPLGVVQFLSYLHNASSTSWQLNQELVHLIMAALGYAEVTVFAPGQYPEYPDEHRQRNLLFRPHRSRFADISTAIASRYYGFLQRLPSLCAKYQSLGLAGNNYYLCRRGLLGPFGILRPQVESTRYAALRNGEVRAALLQDSGDVLAPAFEALLAQLITGIHEGGLKALGEAYARLFVDWFPTAFLEGLATNLTHAHAALQLGNVGGVIGEDLTTDAGYFECAAARLANKLVVGVQHTAGHYGYIEDMSLVGQFEYALCDRLITWGWTHIDEHLPKCPTVPLPAPKLSEQPLRSDYARAAKNGNKEKRDVLFLSNLFHRFPHVSTCGQSRVDFIDEITASQEDVMRALREGGVTVDHKPFSMKYVDLYPEHYARIAAAGGTGYRLLQSTHKGLAVDFVKTCRIVLWDQLGSGAIECLTSQVPTMVYWQRIYSREAPWARHEIAELERCGIVHSNAASVAREMQIYLSDPEEWMAATDRKLAIDAFCLRFALTDSRWFDAWKRQLGQWARSDTA